MKSKSKSSILLTSIVLILFVQVISISPFSMAVDPSTTVVKWDWLSVTKEDFVSSTSYPNDKIWSRIGGEDLISFTPIGVSHEDSTSTVLVYKAEAVFGFEVTAHTSVSFNDIYPNINIDNEVEEWFFTLYTAIPYDTKVASYSFIYSDIDKGSVYHTYDYAGYIPITVGWKEQTGTNDIDINGLTLSAPYYTADIMQTRITSVKYGEVGDYQDLFTGDSQEQEGSVNFVVLTDLDPDQQEVVDYLDEADIGWRPIGVPERQANVQNYFRYGEDGTKHNPNPLENKKYTFQLGAQLRPEVYEYTQKFEVTKAIIRLWEWDFGGYEVGDIEIWYGPETSDYESLVAIHTTNQFVHWDLEVDVNIYATVECSAELSETILGDPLLEFGDFIWDPNFLGTKQVDVPITPGPDDDWWIWLIVALIVGIGIYIGYKILKKRSERSFMLQLAGRGKYKGV